MTRVDRIVVCALACAVIAPLPIVAMSMHPHSIAKPTAKVVSLR
jgi:hypothetical protein